jgi:Xaa-Pro aminopeptidase
MTRTIYLGKPTKKEKQIYEELLTVQETMIQKTIIGTKAKKLYEETLKIMKNQNYSYMA